MQTTISHYYATRQAQSHYNAMAIKNAGIKIRCMGKTEIFKEIVDRQRAAIDSALTKAGYPKGKRQTLCKKAGFSEATLRNYINGDSKSMGSTILARLADAAEISMSELLGENSIKTDSPAHQPIREVDIAILSAIQGLISLMSTKNIIKESDLGLIFVQQMKSFRMNNQSDATEVMDLLLNSLDQRKELPSSQIAQQSP